MKTIICSIMDDKYVKEYEMMYEEQEVNEFLDGLEKTVILPTKSNDNNMRLHIVMMQSEKYDNENSILNYNDVKSYVRKLHESASLDLTELYILMQSNGDMRNNEVRELFRNFFNLYTYKEIAKYDMYYMNQINRKLYELGGNIPKLDSNIGTINAKALENIGFNIETKINEQKHQKVIK